MHVGEGGRRTLERVAALLHNGRQDGRPGAELDGGVGPFGPPRWISVRPGRRQVHQLGVQICHPTEREVQQMEWTP